MFGIINQETNIGIQVVSTTKGKTLLCYGVEIVFFMVCKIISRRVAVLIHSIYRQTAEDEQNNDLISSFHLL